MNKVGVDEFYESLDNFMVLLFIIAVVLILVYEFNLHRRLKKGTH